VDGDYQNPLDPNLVVLVQQEMERSYEKFGEQNHQPERWLTILGEEYGEACQAALKMTFDGQPAQNYVDELLQVAAVALNAIQSFERQGRFFTRADERVLLARIEQLETALNKIATFNPSPIWDKQGMIDIATEALEESPWLDYAMDQKYNTPQVVDPMAHMHKPITKEMLEDAPGFETFVREEVAKRFADAITEPMLSHISDCENCTSKDRNWCWMNTHGSIRTDVTGSCGCKCHA